MLVHKGAKFDYLERFVLNLATNVTSLR